MSMVTTSPAGSKPAQAAARRKSGTPTQPDPERVILHARIDVIARSRMMADARRIARAAAELLELLEAFGEEHTANSIVAEARAAGVEINEEHNRHLAANMLYDAKGTAYAVESFVSFFTSELFEEDAGELKQAAVRKPR